MEKGRREIQMQMRTSQTEGSMTIPTGISSSDLPSILPINQASNFSKMPFVNREVSGEVQNQIRDQLINGQIQEESVVSDDSEEMGYIIANNSIKSGN